MFQTGEVIGLQSDTGRFLSRISRSGLDPVEAAMASIDAFSRFTVTTLDETTVALQADNGLYLSRIKRGDVTRSEALLREAFAATRQIRPEGHPAAVRPALALARWHMRTGRFEEVERLSIEGDRQLAAVYGVSHPMRIKALDQIIDLYEAWGRRDQAEKYRRERGIAQVRAR